MLLLDRIAASYAENPDGKKSKLLIISARCRLQPLVKLHSTVLGCIFQFLIMFIVVLYDFIYALSELCSVVSHEIGSLQWFSVFMQFFVALRIGISSGSFLLTAR